MAGILSKGDELIQNQFKSKDKSPSHHSNNCFTINQATICHKNRQSLNYVHNSSNVLYLHHYTPKLHNNQLKDTKYKGQFNVADNVLFDFML